MSKVALERLTSSFGFQAAFNETLAKIENEFSDKVLYRDNPVGTANTMNNDLDMGGYDILNVGGIDGSAILIEGTPLYTVLENAVYQTIINPDDPFQVHDGIEKFVTTTVDLDNLHSSGWYYTADIGSEHPVPNAAGWLLIFARGEDGVATQYTMQVFIQHNINFRFYVRVKVDALGEWTEWNEVGARTEVEAHIASTTAHDIPEQIDDLRVELTAVTDALDARLDIHELNHMLVTVKTDEMILSTTPQTLMGNIDIVTQGITRNPDGSVTYPSIGRYIVTTTAKVTVAVGTTIYMWVEKYNTGTLAWDPVPYSGFSRTFANAHEVEISNTYMRNVAVANETYRIRINKAAVGTASLVPATLANGTVMPSFRLDLRN